MRVRNYVEADREAMADIGVRAFEPVAIDVSIEKLFGELRGTTWQDRKRRAIDAGLDPNPDGCFVAEIEGRVAGFVTTAVDDETGVGRIIDLAVDPEYQRRGIGKALVTRALDYFGEQGLEHTRIETVTTNEPGMHLYPGVGYREVARQISYCMRLCDRKDR